MPGLNLSCSDSFEKINDSVLMYRFLENKWFKQKFVRKENKNCTIIIIIM